MSRRPSLVLVLVATLAACGSSPTPDPASPASTRSAPSVAATTAAPHATMEPSPPPAWKDASVTHPAAVDAFASQPPGYYCDPCHNLAEDNLFGVGAVPGGFIATGAVTPPASAIALWSADGGTWTPLPGFSSDDGSAAVAVAAGAGGRIVIVGHDPGGATAWAFDPHGVWTRAPAQASLAVPFAAGGMTAVMAFGSGFVGAGYRDDPAMARSSGAVWRSTDGLRWSLDAAGDAFAGGRIFGLASHGDALVAVGTAGDLIRGPAAAWRWTASTGWRAATVPSGGGAMRAVEATATGLVAVGVNGTDTGAMTWTSRDGSSWQPAADQPAFHFYELAVRLQALAVVGGTLVAGGWRSDPGKGSSVMITSSDGVTWTALPWQASFSGGQVDGLASAGTTLVAAGRVGYPDTDTAAIWVRAWP
jgi:hypothetical protein